MTSKGGERCPPGVEEEVDCHEEGGRLTARRGERYPPGGGGRLTARRRWEVDRQAEGERLTAKRGERCPPGGGMEVDCQARGMKGGCTVKNHDAFEKG